MHHIVQYAGWEVGAKADPLVSQFPWGIKRRGVLGRNGVLDVPEHRGEVWGGPGFHDLEKTLLCMDIVLAIVILCLL